MLRTSPPFYPTTFMPIIGNLSEFPLPEILNLIGRRTGKMRLLDVPEYGVMELHLRDGEIRSIQMPGGALEDENQVVDKLCHVVRAQCGMFEFNESSPRAILGHGAFPIQQMVMNLVFAVDEMNAQSVQDPNARFVLIASPEIWLEPDLQSFFDQTQELFVTAPTAKDIADTLGRDLAEVMAHLNNLLSLNIIQVLPSEVGDDDAQGKTKPFVLPKQSPAEDDTSGFHGYKAHA
ncbi:hypothetical protein DB346_10215 [Verrucomicrobia bacterium LW23]|nr:hypothetical protein DB346_10215 [Verrucomicrobia bacterium LW23]